MSELYDRRWRVTVDALEITELRCVFSIERSLEPEPNTCELRIYNLTPDQRAQIQELQPKAGATRGIPVKIEAGYAGSGLEQKWLGDLRHAVSIYQGADWITTLTSGDGEKANQHARIAQPFGPKTGTATALRAVVKALGVDEGNLSSAIAKLKLGNTGKLYTGGKVLNGPAMRVLRDICASADLEVSIQDGALLFLDRGKVRNGRAVVLNSETGLLGSPSVDNDGNLDCKTLMIPDIRTGSLLVVESKTVEGNSRIERTRCSGDTHGQEWGYEIQARRY